MRALRRLALLALALPLSASADVEDLFPSLVQQAQTQMLPVVTINGGANPGVFVADGNTTVDGLFDSGASLANLTSQVASQFQRFPVGSTVSAFTFQFDPELNVFTRSSEGLGPLQSDRAQTLGKGKINVSFAYSRVEFDVFEGEDLDSIDLGFSGAVLGASGANTSFTFNSGQSNMGFFLDVPVGSGGQIQFADASGDGVIQGPGLAGNHNAAFTSGTVDFAGVRPVLHSELAVDVFAFFLNYGITDWLDIGAVIPLLYVKGSGQVTTFGVTSVPGGILQTQEEDADSFGFGDILLRTKARLLTSQYVDLALRGDVTLPTGNENDFRGYGDPSYGGTLILSKTFGIVSPHANAGLNFRTDDPDLHTFRWAAGFDLQPLEVLTLTTDFVGEHLLRDEEDIGENIFGVAGGLKINPWGRLVLAGNALVRLNGQGLRANVIPSVAIEYTF